MSDRSPEVHLVAYLTARPGCEQALAETLLSIVPAVRREPGCLQYNAHVSRESPGTVVMWEIWQDQAALDIHAAAANLESIGPRLAELLAEKPRLEHMSRIG